MANIAKALKDELNRIKNPINFDGLHGAEFSVCVSASASPSAEDEEEHFISGVTSGSYSQYRAFPSGTPWGEETRVPVITKRTFLFCIYCGRKYLLKEENIKTPLLEMNCDCGGELEFKEEEDG